MKYAPTWFILLSDEHKHLKNCSYGKESWEPFELTHGLVGCSSEPAIPG